MTHPYAADRESAVEWLESELRFVDRTRLRTAPASEYSVSLPYDVAVLVLDCARKGLRKGQGRGGRRLGRFSNLWRMAPIWWAKSRKDELVATGMTSIEAENQAAEEASDFARERYRLKLAAGTIKREMGYCDYGLVQRVATHWD
jgi:hypothetical protein